MNAVISSFARRSPRCRMRSSRQRHRSSTRQGLDRQGLDRQGLDPPRARPAKGLDPPRARPAKGSTRQGLDPPRARPAKGSTRQGASSAIDQRPRFPWPSRQSRLGSRRVHPGRPRDPAWAVGACILAGREIPPSSVPRPPDCRPYLPLPALSATRPFLPLVLICHSGRVDPPGHGVARLRAVWSSTGARDSRCRDGGRSRRESAATSALAAAGN
jgi:hypothetical protein